MNPSLSIHWLLNSPLSCYNIDTQKAGPLKRRWPCDIRSVKDRPATRQSYTRTFFYYFQKTTLLYKRNKHSSSWAGVLLKYWFYKVPYWYLSQTVLSFYSWLTMQLCLGGIKLTQFSPNSMAYREPALLLVEIIVVIVMIIIVEVIMVMGIAVIVVVHCVQGFNVPQRIWHRVVVMLVRSVSVIRIG